MLPPLLVGFTISAAAVFAAAKALGLLVHLATIPLAILVATVLGASAAVDLAFPRVRPTLFNRQTPVSFSSGMPDAVTGLLWGLDTGTVVSTFRASAASWSALALTFVGWGPWWVGGAYAAGFCIPLGAMTLTYPAAQGAAGTAAWRRRETEVLVDVLAGRACFVRFAAAFAALAGAGVALATAVG